MNDICTCPICFLPYDQVIPVVASCGHSLCRECSIAIGRKGNYSCPICEGESVLPLPKNLELINLLEFLHLQLDISTPRKISCLDNNEVPKGLPEEILLQDETSVLYNTTFRGIPVVMKSCLYANNFQYDIEVIILKMLCHPNINPLLAHSPCPSTTENSSLIFEHIPNGKLSTYFHSLTKGDGIPSLLTKEIRLKIAIGVLKAVLYIQGQRQSIYDALQTSLGFSMPTMLLPKQVLSQHILLDVHYNAKMLLMPETGSFFPEQTTSLPVASAVGTIDAGGTDDDDGSSEKSTDSPHDFLAIKSIGYLLLELLFNQPLDSFAASLQGYTSSGELTADMNACIQSGNPIMSQYSTEGPHDAVQVDTLFAQPLHTLAMACLDIEEKLILDPLSTRQVLLQLLHIRKNLAATAEDHPPPSLTPIKCPTSKKNKRENKTPPSSSTVPKKSISAPNITKPPASSSLASKKAQSRSKPTSKPSSSSSPAQHPSVPPHSRQQQPASLPGVRKSKKKTSHHPGYYHSQPYHTAGDSPIPV